jgi:hypothetical protein
LKSTTLTTRPRTHPEGGVKRQFFFKRPLGKRIKEELKKEHKCHDIWDRRFQKPLRQSHTEQFKNRLKSYVDQNYSFDQAYASASNDEFEKEVETK